MLERHDCEGGGRAVAQQSRTVGDVASIDSDSQGLVMGAIIIGMTCRSTQQRSPYESCLNGPFKGLYRLDDLKGDSRNLALLSSAEGMVWHRQPRVAQSPQFENF
jgi:hypothetical protein